MEYYFRKKDDLPSIPELPDPFEKPDGSRVMTPEEWPAQREYLKELLAHYLYGHMPKDSGVTKGEVVFSRPVYNGKAVADDPHLIVQAENYTQQALRWYPP